MTGQCRRRHFTCRAALAEVQTATGSQVFAPRKSHVQHCYQSWPKDIQLELLHKQWMSRGRGEIIKSGAQLHFLPLGKAVTGFAEPSARAGGRGRIPPLPLLFHSHFGAFLSNPGTLPERKPLLLPSPAAPALWQQHPLAMAFARAVGE